MIPPDEACHRIAEMVFIVEESDASVPVTGEPGLRRGGYARYLGDMLRAEARDR